jgi:hypothetical protein
MRTRLPAWSALIQGMSVLARDGASRETLQVVAKAVMKAWPSMAE